MLSIKRSMIFGLTVSSLTTYAKSPICLLMVTRQTKSSARGQTCFLMVSILATNFATGCICCISPQCEYPIKLDVCLTFKFQIADIFFVLHCPMFQRDFRKQLQNPITAPDFSKMSYKAISSFWRNLVFLCRPNAIGRICTSYVD